MEEFTVHPLLAKMHAMNITNVTIFRGYVGPGATEEYIKLYSSLRDLSRSVEIAKADIVHFEKTPESLLPFNAITIWLRKDAQVTAHNVETTEAGVKKERNFTEVNKGRLRILVRQGLTRACTSECDCVCESICNCYAQCDCITLP